MSAATYYVTGHNAGSSSKAHAEKLAKIRSQRDPASQTGVFTVSGDRANRKKTYVAVFLNGSKLPRSAWFVGFKKVRA